MWRLCVSRVGISPLKKVDDPMDKAIAVSTVMALKRSEAWRPLSHRVIRNSLKTGF
jgi:hypothetical protein